MTLTDQLTDRIPDRHTIDTLMLIDDNTFDQLICKRVTAKTGLVGNLLQYLDAQQALDHLVDPDAATPDLILLDINMPKMDGFEFLAAVHDRFRKGLCPIIVMLDPALDPKGEARARVFPMVQGFLAKPLTPEDLQGFADLLRDLR
jgi:CheY-like chemotaxis protein